jgi:hypothetical protein
MRNHDFVSDGSLALIVTALVLLCSSSLVLALASLGGGGLGGRAALKAKRK